MAKLNQKQIQQRIVELLDAAPGGLRWAAILNTIQAEHPETPSGTLRGAARLLF